MSLPATPPNYGTGNAGWRVMLAPIKQGENGWRAYAIQRVVGVTADGAWGPITDKAVRSWQKKKKLTVDGIAGPATQMAMLLDCAVRVDSHSTGEVPHGVLKGLIEGEGAGILAATNWYTPPGGELGVDCGPIQWRQYGPPFSKSGLLAAFDAEVSLQQASDTLATRMTDYHRRRPSLVGRALLNTAVLAHNAPFLAEEIVENGRLTSPNAVATWTTNPDGGHYTEGEWANVYPATILKYV